ncbi:hypothetical protein D9C73_024308 [Collichthys lucidus]|uniref:Uncharacterized protein n=1 Tax=Collichthys lucidus TaxID=240159 RepID=A0A4U5VNW0_COLLU|nr:hypothetical protein D9C73_024308 [Collichthys lucidus]
MEVREEVLDILQKVWTKLLGLPQASPLELGAFFVLILFVAKQGMLLFSVAKATESPEEWVDWFLHRLHQEPWALGGLVVTGLFVLTVLSMIIFALLYGCCCSRVGSNQERKQKKNTVI